MTQDTARGLALGTGARAAARSTSALLYNVAGLSVGRVYHLETDVAYFARERTLAAAAGVADSLTSALAAGLSARWLRSLGTGGYSGLDFRLGFALPLSDALSVGALGRYLSLNRQGSGPKGDKTKLRVTKGIALGAAIRARLLEQCELALLAGNVLSTAGDRTPRRLGASVAVDFAGAATVGADLLHVTAAGGYVIAGAGAEYRHELLALRAGYRYQGLAERHALSAGLGYSKPRAALDLSLRRALSGSDTTLMLALRYFVQ